MITWLFLFLSSAVAQQGLTAQVFQLTGDTNVNNVKLSWTNSDPNLEAYSIQRKSDSTSFSTVASVSGNTFDDYNLDLGRYVYRVVSSARQSNEANATAFTPKTSEFASYDNTKPSTVDRKPDIYVNQLYYRYNYVENDNHTFFIQEQSSKDGFDFGGERNVLTSDTICSGISEGCKLERTTFNLHPTTGQVVMWGHLESNQNYNMAQVSCASGKPGAAWKFNGRSRPLDHDSRDMTIFVDDDHSAYLISSINTNTDMAIMHLTLNWTAVDTQTSTVLEKQHREAPAMIKEDGVYYLFTSRAAGWYPSEPLYITSTSLKSGWSEPKRPANPATYSSQSGGVDAIGNTRAMMGDRWSANWVPNGGENRQYMMPLSLGSDQDQGFAHYKYYGKTSYRKYGDFDSTQADVFGVQSGKILSVNKKLTVSPSGGSNLTKANDGDSDSADVYFEPSGYPFSLTVDLGREYSITQVDLTTRMTQGSEAFYQFRVLGSGDGSNYQEIADQSKNTQVGHVPAFISSDQKHRYVQLNVTDVINTHNNNSATYMGGIIEYTVYGR